MPTGISGPCLAKSEDVLITLSCLVQIVSPERDANDARHVGCPDNSFDYRVRPREQPDERPPVGRPLLPGALRRRLPRNEFPALRRFCPGIEDHEPHAARLAVELRLDRRAA